MQTRLKQQIRPPAVAERGKGDSAAAARQAPTRTMREVAVTSAKSLRMREAGVVADPAPEETRPATPTNKAVWLAMRVVMQKEVPQLATRMEAVTTMVTIIGVNVPMTHVAQARIEVMVGMIAVVGVRTHVKILERWALAVSEEDVVGQPIVVVEVSATAESTDQTGSSTQP